MTRMIIQHMDTCAPCGRLLCHAVLQRHRIFKTGIWSFLLLSTMLQQRTFPCSWAAVSHCLALAADTKGVTVTPQCHDGSSLAVDPVVGCDGLRSQTRSILKGVSTAHPDLI